MTHAPNDPGVIEPGSRDRRLVLAHDAEMKRTLAGQVATLMLMSLLTAACGGESHDCGGAGGTDFIVVSVEPSVRARLTSFRLKLCQSGRCEAGDFSTKKTTDKHKYRNKYVVGLHHLGRDWDPDAEARLDFRGRSATGKTVVRHTESFIFEHWYPNTKECDVEPYLKYTMRVGRSDLVRRSG
jgi:hypothetical protein